MKLAQTIAFRYLRSKRRIGFVTVISMISIGGVTVGVAALIIVLSVFNGFNGLVTSILLNFDPHLRIEGNRAQSLEGYDTLVDYLDHQDHVSGFAPYVSGKALVVFRNINRVITLKGIENARIDAVSGIRNTVVLGSFDVSRKGRDGIVIGLTLADRLGAVVGDTISIVSPAGTEPALLQMGQPLIRRFVVNGIYESRNKDYDGLYAFVSLLAGQELFEMGNSVNGLEVRLSDLSETGAIASRLESQVGRDFRVLTWYDLHRELYSMMEIERWMAYVILSLIIGVASFNLLGSLTMSVIEKTRDIGILQSMGARQTTIQNVFIFQGLYVGLLGSVLGVLLGVLLVFLQQEFSLVPLDPTVYIIPAIPVDLHLSDVVLVPVTAILLCSLAALYPSRRAATLIPVEAIRWE
jgi:lipoprotein-releasing system permease protein